jgi:hypothetical protein
MSWAHFNGYARIHRMVIQRPMPFLRLPGAGWALEIQQPAVPA